MGARLREKFAANGLARAFLYLVIPFGLVLVFLTPPGDAPDEGGHLLRAEALLHGEIAGHRQVVNTPDGRAVTAAGVIADPAVTWDCAGWPVAPAWLLPARFKFKWTRHPVFIAIDPLAVYFPLYYIAPAAGIGAAKLLRASPYDAIFLARLAGFCTFALLGLLALSTARFGRAILFVILAVPMTVSLGASANQDGALIATACLGFALLTAGHRRAAGLCLGGIILVKPPYALLALALLFPLPPLARFRASHGALLRRAGLAILTVLPGLLWFVWTMAAVAAPIDRPAYHPGPLWPGDPATVFYAVAPAAQLRCVLAHPIAFLHIFVASTFGSWRLLVHETIGIIGDQDDFLPSGLYILWAVAAAAALLSEIPAGPPGRTTPLTASLALVIGAATVLLVWLSQYLNWTNVGAMDILGPSGRYLLPVLPVLIFLVPRGVFPGGRALHHVGAWLPVLAALVDLAIVPGWFAQTGNIT